MNTSNTDWEEIIFSESVDINPKIILDKEENYPYIDMQKVEPKFRHVKSNIRREFKGGSSRFKNKDVIMARITPCLENGKIAQFKGELYDDTAFGSTEFIIFRGKTNVSDSNFIYYLINWDYVKQYAVKNMSGTSGRQRVSIDIFNYLKIKLPPLSEQRAIASVLGSLDDKIELNHRMNRTLEAMAQALFKSWFVDFDPVRAKAEGRQPVGMDEETAALFPDEFEDSEIGEIPKGWMIKSLKELFPTDNNCVITGPFGSNLHASDYCQKGVPLILVKNINNGRIIESDFPLVGNYKFPELNRYRLKIGDIVFTRVGAVGRTAYIYSRYEGWLISGQLLRVRIPNNMILNPRYLSQIYLQSLFIEMVENFALGTTRPSLNTKILYELKFLTPPIEIQNCFTNIIHQFDLKNYNNLEESITLSTIRDTLLPKLLSGEIRIKAIV